MASCEWFLLFCTVKLVDTGMHLWPQFRNLTVALRTALESRPITWFTGKSSSRHAGRSPDFEAMCSLVRGVLYSLKPEEGH